MGAIATPAARRPGDARPRPRRVARLHAMPLGRLPADDARLGLAVVSAPRASPAAVAAVGRAAIGPRGWRSANGSWPAGTPSIASPRPRSATLVERTSRPTRRRCSPRSGELPGTGLHGDLKLANVAPARRRPGGAHRLADDDRSRRSRSSSAGCSCRTREPADRTPDEVWPAIDRGRARRARAAAASASRRSDRGAANEPIRRCRRAASTRPSATGTPRSTWPGSSGCCCAAGARASTPRRAPSLGSGVARRRRPRLWSDRAVDAAARRL